MSKTAEGLVSYCKAQLGRPYWWGTFGQIATESLYVQKMEQYPSYYTDSDFESQYGQRVHDCVGLIKGYRWSSSPSAAPKYKSNQDVSVEGLYAQCGLKGRLDTMPDIPGVCVFMGSLGHVGVYIGGGKVIEARGHAYGVQETYLNRRGWSFWGMPDWLDYEGVSKDEEEAEITEPTPERVGQKFSLELYYLGLGDKGEDVRSLQQMLIAKGFPCGRYGADGELGYDTLNALRDYQRSVRLDPDGEYGPLTAAYMLGVS